jgi:hypothetical protein
MNLPSGEIRGHETGLLRKPYWLTAFEADPPKRSYAITSRHVYHPPSIWRDVRLTIVAAGRQLL